MKQSLPVDKTLLLGKMTGSTRDVQIAKRIAQQKFMGYFSRGTASARTEDVLFGKILSAMLHFNDKKAQDAISRAQLHDETFSPADRIKLDILDGNFNMAYVSCSYSSACNSYNKAVEGAEKLVRAISFKLGPNLKNEDVREFMEAVSLLYTAHHNRAIARKKLGIETYSEDLAVCKRLSGREVSLLGLDLIQDVAFRNILQSSGQNTIY
jgi:hypothetical protein